MERKQKPAKRRQSDRLVEQHGGERHPKHRQYDRSADKRAVSKLVKTPLD